MTLAIVEYILEIFPGAASNITYRLDDELGSYCYPLHCACCNWDCPDGVIELLVEKCPQALSHMCLVGSGVWTNPNELLMYAEPIEGLPLHYLLGRQSSNIGIDVVILLVRGYPEALSTADDGEKCTPMHVLLCNPHIKTLPDIVQFLAEANPPCNFWIPVKEIL